MYALISTNYNRVRFKLISRPNAVLEGNRTVYTALAWHGVAQSRHQQQAVTVMVTRIHETARSSAFRRSGVGKRLCTADALVASASLMRRLGAQPSNQPV